MSFSLLSFNFFCRTWFLFWHIITLIFKHRLLFFLLNFFYRLILSCWWGAFVNLLTYDREIICCSWAGYSDSIGIAFLDKQIAFCDNVCCSDMFIDLLNIIVSCILINIDHNLSRWRVFLAMSSLIKCPVLIDFQLWLVLARFLQLVAVKLLDWDRGRFTFLRGVDCGLEMLGLENRFALNQHIRMLMILPLATLYRVFFWL